MTKLTITLGGILLVVIGFGDGKGLLPMALHQALKLRKKDTVNLDGDITKSDVIAYFQMARFLYNQPDKCVIDAFLQLNPEKYSDDRAFSHICEVARQMGDSRFPEPAKASYTKEDIRFVQSHVANFNQMAEVDSNLQTKRAEIETHRKKRFEAYDACQRIPFDDPMYSCLHEEYDLLNRDQKTLSEEINVIELEYAQLGNRLPSLTLAQVQVCEVLGYINCLKYTLASKFDIDLQTVTREQLDELSVAIVMALLVRSIQVRCIKNAKEFYIQKLIDRNVPTLLPASLCKRWSEGRPNDGETKLKFNSNVTHSDLYHTNSWKTALTRLAEYEVFCQLWSEASVRKFVATTMVGSRAQNQVLKKTTIEDLMVYIDMRKDTGISREGKINAIIREYLDRPTCPEKYRKTKYVDHEDSHLNGAEVDDGISVHRAELRQIAMRILAEREKKVAKAPNAQMAQALAAAK